MSTVGGRRRRTHRRHHMAGAGFWGDLVSGAHNFLKKSKLISTVGSALGGVGVPYAGNIGSIAGSLGYGRRRVGRPRGRGVGLRRHVGRGAMLF